MNEVSNCSNPRGKFITFEGTEGAGKSTQISKAAAYLESKGFAVVVTREPGGTPLSEKIRALLLQDDMADMTELLLMFAARAEHLDKVIIPALKQGQWVLCDRFTESSYAYQGYARKQSLEQIATLENLVQKSLRPDCTFWFDIPVVEGMKRVAARKGKSDRFEAEDLIFFEDVHRGFCQLAQERPSQFFRIDAKQTIENVQQQIIDRLEELM